MSHRCKVDFVDTKYSVSYNYHIHSFVHRPRGTLALNMPVVLLKAMNDKRASKEYLARKPSINSSTKDLL